MDGKSTRVPFSIHGRTDIATIPPGANTALRQGRLAMTGCGRKREIDGEVDRVEQPAPMFQRRVTFGQFPLAPPSHKRGKRRRGGGLGGRAAARCGAVGRGEFGEQNIQCLGVTDKVIQHDDHHVVVLSREHAQPQQWRFGRIQFRDQFVDGLRQVDRGVESLHVDGVGGPTEYEGGSAGEQLQVRTQRVMPQEPPNSLGEPFDIHALRDGQCTDDGVGVAIGSELLVRPDGTLGGDQLLYTGRRRRTARATGAAVAGSKAAVRRMSSRVGLPRRRCETGTVTPASRRMSAASRTAMSE